MFNTIHIFGSGDTQFINQDKNKIVPAASLSSQNAFVDHVKTLVPEDTTLTDYHVIHLFKDMDVRYLGKNAEDKKEKTSFSVKIDQVNQTLLNNFVTELEAAVDALP